MLALGGDPLVALVIITAAKEEVRRCTAKTEKAHIGRRSGRDGWFFQPDSVNLVKMHHIHYITAVCT